MAMVVLAGAAGAPGVTTTALGWTLAWPRPVVLVDADRDAAQAVLAGHLGGAAPGVAGLPGLAQAHREGRALDIAAQAIGLGEDRAFVPGFANPGQVRWFGPVWPGLAHALQAIASRGTDVIVDAGRLHGEGLPVPLAQAADVVLLVVGSSLRSLAAARHHVGPLEEATGGRPGTVGLVVVGPGRPYSAAEVEAQFRVPVLAELPWDPTHAAVLSDGQAARGRGVLPRALAATAAALSGCLEGRRAEVGSIA